MTAERRRRFRIPTNVLFSFQSEADRNEVARGCMLNLSASGAAFESEAPLKKGQKLFLELQVPVRFEAHVVRAQADGKRANYGVRFEKMGILRRWLLSHYVKRALMGEIVEYRR
ncbi:MAG: hypothetical protein A3G41_08405 [Elusimicrobia bacterium RIFCSPLOWO2_12_FULL_59_9]|nr:MAG: hypothetical protein A3G41_08405 [Elusimicrobia bacterium RIFCSPLOWO2_12_FULL_59_9]